MLCSLGSYDFTVAVPDLWLRFLLLDTRVSGQGFSEGFVFHFFSYFGIHVLVRFHFTSISVLNQVEPIALVLRTKLTGTLSTQNIQVSILSVLAQKTFFFRFSTLLKL